MDCAKKVWGRAWMLPLLAMLGACEAGEEKGECSPYDPDTGMCGAPKSGGNFGRDTDDYEQTNGIEWLTTVVSSEDTPDLRDGQVRLFLPEGTTRVRGVLVFSRNGVGGWEYEHPSWRAAASAQGLALVDIELWDRADRVTPWESAEQSAIFIDRMFSVLAKLSSHPELERAPLFFFGHSAGAFWFTRLIPLLAARTAGFIAFQGSLTCDGLFAPETTAIPGLFLIAEYDPFWIRADSSEIVAQGVNQGALWSLFVQPDLGHWDVDPFRPMMITFMETVFSKRLLRSEANETERLKPFPLDDVRLGHLAHHTVFDGDEQFEDSGREVITGAYLLPEGTPLDTPGTLHRLVSSDFAAMWLFNELLGVDPRTVL